MTAAKQSAAFRPLLKWPGGKAREWDRIEPWLPEGVRHLADPFMGGLAPFARTQFSGHAFLSDLHPRLVDVHQRVQRLDPQFLAEMDGIAADWDRLAAVVDQMRAPFHDAVDAGRSGRTLPALPSPEVAGFHRAAVGGRPLAEFVRESVADKAARIPRLERRHERAFEPAELLAQAATAVRAGYYYLVRAHEEEAASAGDGAAAAADFLFVRDTCYGSMFRFGKGGRFNIPYGGASYNAKSLRARAARLRSPATVLALRRASFACGDFEPFLDGLHPRLGPQDLVFADPPYDSEFSAYGGAAFGLADHERLAAALTRLPCRFLLVIKETPEVHRIYLAEARRREGARLLTSFGKRYGYNVRGRNDQAARHLLIANYDPPLPPLFSDSSTT